MIPCKFLMKIPSPAHRRLHSEDFEWWAHLGIGFPVGSCLGSLAPDGMKVGLHVKQKLGGLLIHCICWMFAHFFPVADTMQWSSRSYFGVDALTYLHWEDHGFASNLISVPIGMVNPVAILASRSLKWWFIHHFQADKGFFKGCSVL